MLYALNVFDARDDDVDHRYLTTAGPDGQELGGDIVVMGKKTAQVPAHALRATGCRAQHIPAGARG